MAKLIQMQIEATKLSYQRNGVSGIGFYALQFNWKDNIDSGVNFIATFETNENDNSIIVESCRVIDSSNILAGWRGDVFGESINHFLRSLIAKYSVSGVYDLKEIINN